MSTVLVSGASGIVGYGILRSLSKFDSSIKLVGTTIYDDSVAQGFSDIFEQAPLTNSPNYMSWLLRIIEKHGVDLLIPGIEADMYKWDENRSSTGNSGAIALLNDIELINACKDKWAFYKVLNEADFPCVIESSLCDNFDTLSRQFGLPFLLKPRRGFGSKGIVIVRSKEIFAKHQKGMGKILLAQPIIGDDENEFTTSAFCDGRGGFYAAMTLKRKLSKDGFTDKAEVVPTDDFTKTIKDLCKLFRPIGPTNFQFRKSASEIKLLEINPRVSSSTSIRTAFGYNESGMSVDYFLNQKTPTQPRIRRGKAVRYTDEHIFYEDSIYL